MSSTQNKTLPTKLPLFSLSSSLSSDSSVICCYKNGDGFTRPTEVFALSAHVREVFCQLSFHFLKCTITREKTGSMTYRGKKNTNPSDISGNKYTCFV